MIKYKHRNTGDIAELKGQTFFIVDGPHIKGYIPTRCIENSNDWVKITSQDNIKKDYEILTINEWIIYSVKRLSDGVVFSIGDIVDGLGHFDKRLRIDYMLQIDNSIRFYNSGVYFQDLKTIKHAPKPLFTTEDGKEIFEGDRFWSICIDKERYTEQYGKPTVHTLDMFCDYIEARSSGILWFSTREAAEEYIVLNKPCLSVKEVREELSKNHSVFRGYNGSKFINQLKDLVKSKL
jgi:hypothetical protein